MRKMRFRPGDPAGGAYAAPPDHIVTYGKVSGQLQERRAGCREFQILGEATEKLRAPNAVHANGTVSSLLLGRAVAEPDV